MDYDTEAIRKQLETDGYAVLPGFLDATEIARLRAIVGGFFEAGNGVIYSLGQTQPNAAVEVPELSFLFADPRITGFFKQLYGEDGTLFTGHCDIHNSMVSDWHRDTGGPGHPYFDEPCFTDECRVYKMAFYLQDHEDGNGLTVYPGSHKQDGPATGEPVSLMSRAGDAVVFDVRIQHRGRKANLPEWAIHRFATRVADRIPGKPLGSGKSQWTLAARKAMDRATGTDERMSVFFTFAADNRFGRQFARTNMDRQLDQYAPGRRIAYPQGLPEALRNAGIAIYQPEPQPKPQPV